LQASSNFLESMVSLASTSLNYHRQQRVLTHPVVVHCLTGSGKTALFILLASAMAEINLAGGKSETIIPDIVRLSFFCSHLIAKNSFF
jgi:protein tyrosine phosphatase